MSKLHLKERILQRSCYVPAHW